MMSKPIKILFFGGLFLSLMELDEYLGSGFQNSVIGLFSSVKNIFIRNEVIVEEGEPPIEPPADITMYMLEVSVLFLSILILTKYKRFRGNNRIEELLQESKNVLKQTNDVLEKWRLKKRWSETTPRLTNEDQKLNSSLSLANDYSYLFEEPQDIKPITFEVPILHMAMVENRLPRPERGDAGDSVNLLDQKYTSSILDYSFDDVEEYEVRPDEESS